MFSPMRLVRIPKPFDHDDFIYELKYDGFRAFAVVERGCCRLISRNPHEFIVAKWAHGTYQRGLVTSWLKIKNPHYSQMEGRRELFEARRQANVTRLRTVAPVLRLA